FFFQAEDGIRVGHVTGVQTCALPISQENATVVLLVDVSGSMRDGRTSLARIEPETSTSSTTVAFSCGTVRCARGRASAVAAVARSEERRVGKDGRSGRSV